MGKLLFNFFNGVFNKENLTFMVIIIFNNYKYIILNKRNNSLKNQIL